MGINNEIWGIRLLTDFLIPIFIPYKPLCISRLGCGCRSPWRMTIISEHKGVINFHLTTREDGNELWKKIGSTSLSWVAAGTHNGLIYFLKAYSNCDFVKWKKMLWFCDMYVKNIWFCGTKIEIGAGFGLVGNTKKNLGGLFATFEGFVCFHGQNKIKTLKKYCSVRTKKLHKMKVKITYFFFLKI